MVIQTILDLIWLYLYAGHWWSERYVDGNTQGNLRFWTIIASFILFIVRIALCYFVFTIGSMKIVTEESASLSNHYNRGIRNDDFMLEPSFSEERFSEDNLSHP